MKFFISVILIVISILNTSFLGAQTPPKNKEPRIITEQQIKNYWLNTFPQPKSLDRDYYQKKKDYTKLVANIKAGKYDHEAKVKALEWNMEQYTNARDFEMAEQTRRSLQMLLQQEEERKRTSAMESKSNSQQLMESQLGRMESELLRLRIQLNIP
jgi:phosphopantetheinyl transferase (holo-ACP synthase)